MQKINKDIETIKKRNLISDFIRQMIQQTWNLWNTNRKTNIFMMKVLTGEQSLFEEIMAENSLNESKEMDIQI